MSEENKVISDALTAFEEFKSANDARLREIEKRGAADPLLTDKLAKIEKSFDRLEEINQTATLAAQKAKAAEEKAAEFDAIIAKVDAAAGRIGAPGRSAAAEQKQRTNAWARAVFGASTKGEVNLTPDEQKAIASVNAEYKSLNVTTDASGGYLAPLDFVREITKGVTELSPVRSIVRVRQTASKTIQLPKRTGQFAAQWVAEQGTRSETTGLAYGLDELALPELYALIDISNQMLEDPAFDMEAEIRMEAEEQFAVAEGTAIVSGNGTGKPEGFMANASVGFTVSGDAALVTSDGLLSLFYGIKTAYARNATWAMNRTTLGTVRRLKDTTGQYLWNPGLASGTPNTINGAPYVELPDMPNVAANAFPVAFGDFRRGYTMVDRISMEMLRDPYTQATSGNVRFIFRRRLGGKTVLPEAIRKLKIAAS